MKILIVRFSSIGDIVLTTPVVRCLKEQLNCELHYLTKKSFQSVLEESPHIDKLITIKKGIDEVMRDLIQEDYDYVVDLHKNLRTFRLKMGLGTKAYSFHKLNLEKWLMVNWKVDRLPQEHIVDRNLAAIANLGVRNDGKGLEYFIAESDRVDLTQFFAKINPPTYVAFVIGAAHATKRLPTEKIIDICRKANKTIVLLGGPAEKEEGEYIAKEAGEHVVNGCGKLRLNQSASVVAQADVVVTHDTGLMHIAAAYQKRIISIWGNTIPEFGMYPYYPEGQMDHTLFEVKGLSCRPCSKIGYKKCPKKHFNCMQQINTAAIVEQIG
ncbi:MAG: glycosyltransferase family 9 protein [Saprospiraceae bacterium]|jgi:ADP-heptose:LPS heptosyltransferase|nr:glycosyltransferase family 9 protein [Saprospiraceae bacterium]